MLLLKQNVLIFLLKFFHIRNLHLYIVLQHLFLVIELNSFIVFEPQDGQFFGNKNFRLSLALFLISTDKICGITSPALSTNTVSPTLISFLLISSSLCKVAFETNTPPILTVLIFATGVKAPVLPI